MQNCYMPIQVRDEADAKSYPVAANTTVSLMSASADFYGLKALMRAELLYLSGLLNFQKLLKPNRNMLRKQTLTPNLKLLKSGYLNR